MLNKIILISERLFASHVDEGVVEFELFFSELKSEFLRVVVQHFSLMNLILHRSHLLAPKTFYLRYSSSPLTNSHLHTPVIRKINHRHKAKV